MIIQRHTNLVRLLAQKFVRPGVELEDLVQTAWIALIRALDRFDPSHQTLFGTFASYEFIAEDVVWAKLKALSDGAAVATKRLWGRA